MKVEFLEAGSPECPLVRIYGTDHAEFALLRGAARRLERNPGAMISLSEIPGFHSVDGCTLAMMSSAYDVGVRRIGKTMSFEWVQTPSHWSGVAELIDPFSLDPTKGGFQWLAGKEARYQNDAGTISVLISTYSNGSW